MANLTAWWARLVTITPRAACAGASSWAWAPTSASTYRELYVRRTIVEINNAASGNGTRFTWKDYPKGKVAGWSGSRRTRLAAGRGDRSHACGLGPRGPAVLDARGMARNGDGPRSVRLCRSERTSGSAGPRLARLLPPVGVGPDAAEAGVDYRKFHACEPATSVGCWPVARR